MQKWEERDKAALTTEAASVKDMGAATARLAAIEDQAADLGNKLERLVVDDAQDSDAAAPG